MIGIARVVVLALALTACGPLHPDPCSLWVDPLFAPDERAEILAGVDAWRAAAHLPITIADYEQDHTIRLGTEGEAILDEDQRTGAYSQFPMITIYVSRIRPDVADHPHVFRAFAMHELGHHFGLQHCDPCPGRVMQMAVPEDLDHVPEADAQEMRDIYGY